MRKNGLKVCKFVKLGTKMHVSKDEGLELTIYGGHNQNESQNQRTKLYKIKAKGPDVQLLRDLAANSPKTYFLTFWTETQAPRRRFY